MAELLSLQSTISADSAAFVRGVENCRGGLRNLIASLDPAAQATVRFNRNMETLDRALKQGKISADDYATYVGRLRGRMEDVANGQRNLGASTGQLRSGMQQLSYQLGDVSQGFAMGVSPMTIFAQQSGQVVQAVGLMTNSTKGFIGFLAGPWGAVLTGAVTILGAMAVNHSKAADAQDEHKGAADDLAKSIKMLRDQQEKANEATRQGIVDSINHAKAKRDEALANIQAARANYERIRGIVLDPNNAAANPEGPLGALSALSAATFKYSSQLDELEGKLKQQREFIWLKGQDLAVRNATASTQKATKVNDDYEDSLYRLRKALEKGSFGARDSDAAQARFQQQVVAAQQARDVALEAIREADRAESAAERSGSAAAKRAASTAKKQAQEAAREAEKLARDAEKATEQLRQRADSAWASVFPNEERLRGLYDQMRAIDEAMAAQLIDSQRWSAVKARLSEEMSLLRGQIAKEAKTFSILGEGNSAIVVRDLVVANGPDIKNLSKNISEQMKGVAVSAEEAGAAFVTMSERALNSLSNLANSIQGGNILNILADTLNVFASLSQAGLFGKGLQTNFKDFTGVAGFRASGGPVSGGSTYVVGERGPELFTPNRSGYIVPNGANDGGGRAMRVQVVPSPYFDVVVDGRAAAVARPMADSAAVRGAAGGSAMAQETMTRRATRRIPGR